jgi:hypothetical protein
LLGLPQRARRPLPAGFAVPTVTRTRARHSMVSAELDAIGARSDGEYEDPGYVDHWRATFDRGLRPVSA